MKRNRGFTLIELLIVCAIVAIMSAATLTLFVGPFREYARVQLVSGSEAGLAVAVETITSDAHGATGVEVDGSLVRFRRPAGISEAVYTSEGGVLRRFVVPRGAAPTSAAGATLATNLTAVEFKPAPDGSSVSVKLRTANLSPEDLTQREAVWTVSFLSNPEVQP